MFIESKGKSLAVISYFYSYLKLNELTHKFELRYNVCTCTPLYLHTFTFLILGTLPIYMHKIGVFENICLQE